MSMPRRCLTFVSLTLAALLQAQTSGPVGPDPKEIPLPLIPTVFPPRPGPEALPARKDLPDVLIGASGQKITDAKQWAALRQEVRETLEYYAVGHAPPAPGNVQATELRSVALAGGKYRYRLIHLSFGPSKNLGFDVGIYTPAEGGPFPAVIMPTGAPALSTPLPRLPQGPTQGKGVDVLLVVGPREAGAPTATVMPDARKVEPADAEKIAASSIALARGYAYVTFNNNDCGEDTTLREADGSWSFRKTRFFPAYPGYDWGLLRAWAWGASRIVDYLQTDPTIDRTKLIISGVSRTGKSAMVTAAFDDRIAMAAPVVTGGGGIGAYRFAGARGSETLDIMMKKYPNWFSPHLHAFWGKVHRLPFDEHWFLALCAPRPFLALEGTADVISLPEAVRASVDGAKPVYALFQAEDRLGVNYANHGHALTADDWNAMFDFADKHLRGLTVERRFDQFPTLPTQP